MAIVRAVKSGVWSDPTVWAPSPPTSADDVYSNTFTVTIDVSPTVLSISNAAATGVTAGGRFEPTSGITLTCTAVNGASGGGVAVLLVSFLGLGSSCTVILSYSGAGFIVQNSGLGTVNVIGNFVAGGANNQRLIDNGTGGVINITGNCTGGAGASAAHCAFNSAAGTLNITGNVTGGSSGAGAFGLSTGTVNITGTVTGGTRVNDSTGVLTTSAGVINIIGSIVASSGAPGVSSSNASAQIVLTGPFITSANGVNPVYAAAWRWASTNPATYYQIRSANLAVIRPLYTADSVGGNPATSNIRSGTVYGPNNELTGTCAVPGAASVLAGVPIDATVGTVTITAADIRSAVGLSSANLDTQFSNIPANVRTNLSTELARIDTTVSSRLASASYTTPPTSGQNAQAVRTELATELGRIDVATSTRSTFDSATDTVANVTLVATTTNLTNPPDVPTTSEIADAVRVELTPELNHLDADVSSRLASADYTTPPTALENAEAVETQLSLPLGNLDVAISTRSTFDPLSDTVAQVTLVDTTTNLTNPPDVPTTSEIAEAVRVELTPELDRIDTTVSSRSTFNPATDTVAQVALVDTTTNLTNPPDVPTTTEIADAVRTELTPELNRIDTDVSSRLATADYEQAPTSEQNAEAVRVELTPELDRIANCATVATTGEQIQDAWARSPNIP